MTAFEPTKRMSTYLVAFIVCEFTYISKQTKDMDVMVILELIYTFIIVMVQFFLTYLYFFFFTKVRIWARKNAIEQGQGDYALRITQPILEFFEKYYNTSYPLSKSGMTIQIYFFFYTLFSHIIGDGQHALSLRREVRHALVMSHDSIIHLSAKVICNLMHDRCP